MFKQAYLSINKNKKVVNLIIALVIILFATRPFYSNVDSFFNYYLFICFLYITLSQAWNLIGGYAGQISLCSHAIFGLGAYTTAIIWYYDITKTWYYFDPLVMFLSGLVPAIITIIIGIPLLARLRGDYFAFGTLAVGEVIRTLIYRGGNLTRGAVGFNLPSGGFTGMLIYYWISLLLAVLTIAVIYFLIRSKVGLALRAISEDEVSATSHGINVLKYKVLAFGVSSFLMGIGGSLYTYYLFMATPGAVMNNTWMLTPILICVLGGKGTILGPIIASFVVGFLHVYADVYVGLVSPMVSGIIIILVMKFLPAGLMGLKDKIFFAGKHYAQKLRARASILH